MKIKVATASRVVLNWMVAYLVLKSNIKYVGVFGRDLIYSDPGGNTSYLDYSTSWAQGGPIIERERLMIIPLVNPYHGQPWECSTLIPDVGSGHQAIGPTPLIAAMRCYVTSKLGDEVDVPEELLK